MKCSQTVTSFWIAVLIAAGPSLLILFSGISVPLVSQTAFTAPAASMQQGDIWIQTFLFPDRPITSFALRPGTFGRRAEGQVTVWIGAAHIPRSGNREAFGQEITVHLASLHDNRLQVFRIPALEQDAGTRGVIRLSGTGLPPGDVFTLWKNTLDTYPDGQFTINHQIRRGNLVFRLLGRVRGPDAFRMLKSRWQYGLPWFWAHPAWPFLCVAALFPGLFFGFFFLLSRNNRRHR